MKIIRVLTTVAACGLIAACSASTGSEPQSAATADSGPSGIARSGSPVAAEPMPTSSPTGDLSCAGFDQEAAHLLTYAHYASLNVGTNNDTVPLFGDLNEAMGVLTAMAPECAPDAVDAIAALGVSAGEVAAVYRPGDDDAVKDANKAVLEGMRATGVLAWEAMGKDPSAWDTTLRFVE